MSNTVCIDARLWGIKHTGLGRYTQNLIANLPSDPNVKVVLIVSPQGLNEPSLSGFTKYACRFHPYNPLSQLEMSLLLYRIKPHLLHCTHFVIPILWPGKIIVTIHDLIKHYSKGQKTTTLNPGFYWLNYFFYLLTVKIAMLRAVRVLVPSQYWKRVVSDKYGLSSKKIIVTYEGISDTFLKPGHVASLSPLKFPYLLHTGNLYPHKNIGLVISVVNQMAGKIHLALVCSRSVFSDRIPVSPYVHFLGQLTDEQLFVAYKHATAYVFPSLIEGFGLPGLEAMAVGTPVLASNSSCLPEIYGDAAIYFDPHSQDSLLTAISKIISNPSLRTDLIRRGKLQITKYSWSRMAEITWQTYLTELR